MATTTRTQSAPLRSEDLDWAARWASIAIRDQLAEIAKGIPALPTPSDRNELPQIADTPYHRTSADPKTEPAERKSRTSGAPAPAEATDKTYKVGIVGAGCAGLFTGMIFDYLNETYGLNVEYEILESNDSSRLGGRLYTHYFEKVEKSDGPSHLNHDYYDVGAMRFPDSPMMSRVFHLFQDVLKMEKIPAEKAKEGAHQPGDLIPYYLTGNNTKELYNDRVVNNPEGKSTSTADTFNVTGLPKWEAGQRPGDLISETIEVFIRRLQRDPQAGWEYLMAKGDPHSVRSWFLNTLDYDTTEWLETYSYGTAWYDQALSEMILEDQTFSWKEPWWCIEGGTQQIAKRMFKRIEACQSGRVSFNKKVTKLERLLHITSGDPLHPAIDKVALHVQDEKQSREYDAVFNSAPFGAMQRMNLRDLNLNWGTKQAIRSLGYGASCKVGIRFKHMWWLDARFNINKGGVSKTDLPIRMCVYPSYNIYDLERAKRENESKPKEERKDNLQVPGVLLCSYSWSMEAQRMGTLINRESPKGEAELKTLLIDNLAKLHTPEDGDYKEIHDLISGYYESHYAYDWYTDPGTTGAFAYFGPGQFRNMYPYIVRNDGSHIIIGEASSSHHAWVVGALESAVRGVYQFLYKHSKKDAKVNEVLQAYNDNKVPAPYGPIPVEFDRTKDVQPLTAEDVKEGKHAAAQGEWLRQGVLVESIRMMQGGERLDPKAVKREQVAEFLKVDA